MSENKKNNAGFGLTVNKGIEQPPSVTDNASSKLKTKRIPALGIDDYYNGILKKDRTLLAKAITLVESSLDKHRIMASELIEKCIPHSGNSLRIGVSGIPGAGKSTFIEALGKYLTGKGKKVAVLAIDPSSTLSKGSILGDKTRMEELATDPNAFIRPSPSAGTLGGVARKTRESILVCEAAGFDVIFVETVGVGQSETLVHSMVDFFLLVLIPGGGDELQGIKRGIVEMADAILINKADGDNLMAADNARQSYRNALHLMPVPASGWTPNVLTASSLNKTGVEEVWQDIEQYTSFTKNNGYFSQLRKEQDISRFYSTITQELEDMFFKHKKIAELLKKVESEIINKQTSAYKAAYTLLDYFFNPENKKG